MKKIYPVGAKVKISGHPYSLFSDVATITCVPTKEGGVYKAKCQYDSKGGTQILAFKPEWIDHAVYNIGDHVIHNGGGYGDTFHNNRYGIVVGVSKSGKLYELNVISDAGSKQTLNFWDWEIIGYDKENNKEEDMNTKNVVFVKFSNSDKEYLYCAGTKKINKGDELIVNGCNGHRAFVTATTDSANIPVSMLRKFVGDEIVDNLSPIIGSVNMF